MNIAGINKAVLLAALYNRAKPLGLGFLHYRPEAMTTVEALEIIAADHTKDFNRFTNSPLYFDYLKGRVMKVDLGGDEMDTWGYNRDNGKDAAEKIIESLRR